MRSDAIVMGRQDYFSVLLRLIGMELYKLRRRLMSKVIGSITVLLAILLFLFISLGTLVTLNAPAQTFAPPCQSSNPSDCPTLSPSQLEQARQEALRSISSPLRLPTSLNVAVQFALTPCTILIIILAGISAGEEYSVGTVRLLYARGPTRTQFLLAKLGTALLLVIGGLLLMALLGIMTGQALNPISGFAQNGDFFTAEWLGHASLYMLFAMLNWFLYAVIAIFFGTLGRSTVAGIVGALIWFFVEPIVTTVLNLLGNFSPGPFGTFLKAIPDYLIGNNISALLDQQGHYLFGGSEPSLSAVHALIVLAVYFVFFIVLAWRLSTQRDVTN